jgi:hypothetical protein
LAAQGRCPRLHVAFRNRGMILICWQLFEYRTAALRTTEGAGIDPEEEIGRMQCSSLIACRKGCFKMVSHMIPHKHPSRSLSMQWRKGTEGFSVLAYVGSCILPRKFWRRNVARMFEMVLRPSPRKLWRAHESRMFEMLWRKKNIILPDPGSNTYVSPKPPCW